MRPGPTELLNGIKQIIGNALLPELQTEQARAQAMYATVLVDHLIARWELEGARLLDERAELRTLFTQAVAVLDAGDGLAVRMCTTLAESAAAPASPQALDTQNDRLRRLVPLLARALPQQGDDERVRGLDAALRAYIRNQHQRDLQLVEVGSLAW